MQAPSVLSFSSVTLFRSCAAAWKARYIDKIQQPVGDAAKFGNDFDTAVAYELGLVPKAFDGSIPPRPTSQEVLDAVETYRKYQKSWLHSAPGSVQAQVKIEVTPDRWREVAERFGSESEIEVPLIGYSDFVRTLPDGRREVMDLKSTSRDEWKDDWYTQTILYSAWLDASLCHIHRLVRNKSKCRVDASTTIIDGNPKLVKQTLDTFAHDVGEVVRFIKSERWLDAPRRASWRCTFCPLALECETKLVCK